MKTQYRTHGSPSRRLALLLMPCLAAGADAATIVQTREFSFLPYATRTLSFDKFDNHGGNLTLTAVHVTIQYTRSGGYAAYDNESEASATITFTNRLTLLIDTGEVLDLTEMGSSSRLGGATGLRATSSTSATVGADDDPDDPNFNSSGPDYFRFDLPELTVGDSAYMQNTAQFVGNGTFDLQIEGSQQDTSQLLSGMKTSTSPSSVDGFMTITYEYAVTPVPEPKFWSMACFAVGWALLMRRRTY